MKPGDARDDRRDLNSTLNVQSNVWEFWFPLDPNTLPDGPVEVRAKAIPLGAGMIVHELTPLTLYPDGHGLLKFGEPVWPDCTQGDDAADGTQDRLVKTLVAAVTKATKWSVPCFAKSLPS